MANVSSLLNQAAATARQMQTLTDAQQAFQWKNGYMDPTAYQSYTDYLQGRVKNLQGSALPADQEKAMTLANTAMSITSEYNSNQRKLTSNAILEGNASEQDKLNLLADQLRTAVAQGADPTTISSLQGLYDSQAIKIQNLAVTAQNQAIANANAATTAADKHVTAVENAIMRGSVGATDPKKMGIQQLQDALDHSQISKQDFVKYMTQNYLGLYSLYNSAAQDGSLSATQQSSFLGKANEIQNNSEFQKWVGQVGQDAKGNLVATSPMSQALAGGENAFARVKDINTGKWTLQTLPVVGQTPDGMNIYAPHNTAPKTADASGSWIVNKGAAAGGPEGEKIFRENNGSGMWYYRDATTGKMVELNPTTGQRNLIDNAQTMVDKSGKISLQADNPNRNGGDHPGNFIGQAKAYAADNPVMRNALPALSVVGGAAGNALSSSASNFVNAIQHPTNIGAVAKAVGDFENPLHPFQVAQKFAANVAAAVSHVTAHQQALKYAQVPQNQPAYTKSVVNTNPTPFPQAATPAQQNTNTVAAINKAVGMPGL